MTAPIPCGNTPPTLPIVNLGVFRILNETSTSDAGLGLDEQIFLTQLQIDVSFKQYWGKTCNLVKTTNNAILDQTKTIFIRDITDVPGATGYHTPQGNGFVFLFANVEDSIQGDWRRTFSHEVLEMLGDLLPARFPNGKWGPEVMFDGIQGRFIYEACDPVQLPAYNAGRLSNFIFPSWFIAGSPCPWDRLGILTGPMTFTPWGYMPFQQSAPPFTWWNGGPDGLTLSAESPSRSIAEIPRELLICKM